MKTQNDFNEILQTLHHKTKKPVEFEFCGENYVIVSKSEFIQMRDSIQNANKRLIESILEKEIIKEIPKDFDDVYIVARDILEKNIGFKKIPSTSEIRKIVREVKSNYPNLFIDIGNLFDGAKNPQKIQYGGADFDD